MLGFNESYITQNAQSEFHGKKTPQDINASTRIHCCKLFLKQCFGFSQEQQKGSLAAHLQVKHSASCLQADGHHGSPGK